MAKLNSSQVNKFQEIYFRHFGIKLSYSEAENKGMALINLTRNILGTKIALSRNNESDYNKYVDPS